jgi:ABC-type transport system involved in cytochrome bd biosynthesis fused ATPase/permease subunit
LAKHFDRVVVMNDNRIVEQGRYEDLNRPERVLGKLVQAE